MKKSRGAAGGGSETLAVIMERIAAVVKYRARRLTDVYKRQNYNSGMTDYNIPFTACHELSHLRGFMQEEEANFIAYLACSRSDNVQFRYSGNLLGWVYCMSVLHTVDYDAWEEVRQTLAPEVEPDLAANREYWARYDGAVACLLYTSRCV